MNFFLSKSKQKNPNLQGLKKSFKYKNKIIILLEKKYIFLLRSKYKIEIFIKNKKYI